MKDPTQLFKALIAENEKSIRRLKQEIYPVLPLSVRALTITPRLKTGQQLWQDLLTQFTPGTNEYNFYYAGYRAYRRKMGDPID
jgi:hypothetical protein